MTAMLIFTDARTGETVYLPRERLSHWTLAPGGAVTVYAVGGGPLSARDAAAVLAQLPAGGLLPEPGTPRSEGDEAPGAPAPGPGAAPHPPSVEPLASPPEPAPAPPAPTRTRRKP